MWQPSNEYKPKHVWADYEDKALISVWGLTDINEICEAFMCHPSDVIRRARLLGRMPSDFDMIHSQDIEMIVRMFEAGADADLVADTFGLPDFNNRYIEHSHSSLVHGSRIVQDYWAKQNENQLDMFEDNGDTE